MRKSFNVFGKKVPIKNLKETEENKHILGYCSKQPLEIYIKEGLDKQTYEHTLAHELVHAIVFRVGLDQVLNPETHELIAENISTFICENYKLKY